MNQNIINQLRDMLMPLIQESIDVADWNQNEWTTNQWGFDIIYDHQRHETRLFSVTCSDGLARTRYLPYVPDPVVEAAEENLSPGTYGVRACYFSPTDAELYCHYSIYNPAEDVSIARWAMNFIADAKRHAAGLDANQK